MSYDHGCKILYSGIIGYIFRYVPYSSLESVIENSKEEYYLALRQTQGTIRTVAPNWQPWLMFFMRALQQQKRRLATKVEREKNTLATLTELAVKILDYVRDHGRVRRATWCARQAQVRTH